MSDSVTELARKVRLLKALGDKTRLALIIALSGKAYSASALVTAMGLTHNAVRHHIQELLSAGIVWSQPLVEPDEYSLRPSIVSPSPRLLQLTLEGLVVWISLARSYTLDELGAAAAQIAFLANSERLQILQRLAQGLDSINDLVEILPIRRQEIRRHLGGLLTQQLVRVDGAASSGRYSLDSRLHVRSAMDRETVLEVPVGDEVAIHLRFHGGRLANVPARDVEERGPELALIVPADANRDDIVRVLSMLAGLYAELSGGDELILRGGAATHADAGVHAS